MLAHFLVMLIPAIQAWRFFDSVLRFAQYVDDSRSFANASADSAPGAIDAAVPTIT